MQYHIERHFARGALRTRPPNVYRVILDRLRLYPLAADAPQGERRVVYAPDLVGTCGEIIAALRADPIVPMATEFRLDLPYDFPRADYEQILTDLLPIAAALAQGRPCPSHQSARTHGLGNQT